MSLLVLTNIFLFIDSRSLISSQEKKTKFPSLNNTGDISVQSVNDELSTNHTTAANSLSNSQPQSRQKNSHDDLISGEQLEDAKLNDDVFSDQFQEKIVDSNRTPMPLLRKSLTSEKTIYPDQTPSIKKQHKEEEKHTERLYINTETSEHLTNDKINIPNDESTPRHIPEDKELVNVKKISTHRSK
jgi:hypothetical protein